MYMYNHIASCVDDTEKSPSKQGISFKVEVSSQEPEVSLQSACNLNLKNLIPGNGTIWYWMTWHLWFGYTSCHNTIYSLTAMNLLNIKMKIYPTSLVTNEGINSSDTNSYNQF